MAVIESVPQSYTVTSEDDRYRRLAESGIRLRQQGIVLKRPSEHLTRRLICWFFQAG